MGEILCYLQMEVIYIFKKLCTFVNITLKACFRCYKIFAALCVLARLFSLHFLLLQDVLGMLRSLYALICIEDVAFLRYGYLSVDNAAAVRREITKVCSELRPHALALVSSFGIPDAFLSPVAFNWIDANSWSSVQH